MRKATVVLALLGLAHLCALGEQPPQIDMTTTPGLIEAILSKYFDVYCVSPEKLADFAFGQDAVERFHRDGILRIIVMLPDSASKTFDLDQRLSGGRVERIASISRGVSKLAFRTGDSDLSITSTVHIASLRPFIYQVWTLQPR